jgi:G:T-mismatch repair DNA endonuclease (very short patch repair protein)
MPVLSFQQNIRLRATLIDGQYHDRTGMANHVAADTHASGFNHRILGDPENRAAVDNARREHTSFFWTAGCFWHEDNICE